MGISLSRPPVAASSTSAVMSQRVFLARHGERADLADPNWLLSKPEVWPALPQMSACCCFSSLCMAVCAQEPYDAPLTLTGMQQAADLGVLLKVSCGLFTLPGKPLHAIKYRGMSAEGAHSDDLQQPFPAHTADCAPGRPGAGPAGTCGARHLRGLVTTCALSLLHAQCWRSCVQPKQDHACRHLQAKPSVTVECSLQYSAVDGAAAVQARQEFRQTVKAACRSLSQWFTPAAAACSPSPVAA